MVKGKESERPARRALTDRFTLRLRLFIGFITLAGVAILLTAFLFQKAALVERRGDRVADLERAAGATESLRYSISAASLPVRDYLINGASKQSGAWERETRAIQRLLARAKSETHAVYPKSDRAFRRVSQDLSSLRRLQAELFSAKGKADKTLVLSDADLLERRVQSALARIAAEERALADRAGQRLAFDRRDIGLMNNFVAGIVAIVALVLALIAHMGVMRPLSQLQEGVKKIAAGKLDHRIKVAHRDEIGVLADDFNDMAASLKKSYKDLRRRYSQLTNLYKISKAVGTTNDLDDLLHLALRESLALMGAETGSIMLVTADGKELIIKAAEGLNKETIENTRVQLGEGISGYVASSGKPLMIQDDVRKSRVPGSKDVRDALSVPLIANERVIGVINANNKSDSKFDRGDLRFFTTLAGQIASAIDNATLVGSIQEAYFATIKVLAAAIDAKDRYTHGHSERVAKYAVTIAHQMGLPRDDLTRIEAAAYLHDIGKIGVPDGILNKEGPLTNEEHDMIKKHPLKAAEILAHINFPWGDVIPGVRGHHERYDGHGYPDGGLRDAIPKDARIIAVADSYDAMTSDRPYRKGLDRTKAISELVNGRGKQFDCDVVDAFIPALLTDWMSSLPSEMSDRLEFFSGSSADKKVAAGGREAGQKQGLRVLK